MTLQWKFCREVEQEHAENERQYAHTFHYRDTICVCRAFWKLPKAYRDGILLHEIGHLLVGPEGSEREATEAAEEFFGAAIEYADSPYGKQLQRVANMARHGVRIINRQRVVRNALRLRKSEQRYYERDVPAGTRMMYSGSWGTYPVTVLQWKYGHSEKIGYGELFDKALVRSDRGNERVVPYYELRDIVANSRRNPVFAGEDYSTVVRLPADTDQDQDHADELTHKIRRAGFAATYVYKEDRSGRPRYDLYTNASRRYVERLAQ